MCMKYRGQAWNYFPSEWLWPSSLQCSAPWASVSWVSVTMSLLQLFPDLVASPIPFCLFPLETVQLSIYIDLHSRVTQECPQLAGHSRKENKSGDMNFSPRMPKSSVRDQKSGWGPQIFRLQRRSFDIWSHLFYPCSVDGKGEGASCYV